jgi:glycosyltransferase involved in cell wall biosynthesis
LLPPGGQFTQIVIPHPDGYFWMQQAFPRALLESGADVALIQYMGPFHAPCPIVTSIHDTVWRTLPETFPWKDRMILDAFIPGTIRHAAAVTTGSEFARDEILLYYPHAAGKLHVVPYAVDERFRPVTEETRLGQVKRKYELPDKFLLSVGVLQPRKNVEGLIAAYQELPEELRSECSLVITGKHGWLTENVPALAREAGPGVIFTGYVEDDELPALYTLATCFVYPSFYEGFGLPPLEAMACGTPAIVSNAASLPEVTAGAGLLVDPHDVPSLTEAIQHVLTDEDLRQRLRARGLERVKSLTWELSARKLLAVLERAVGRSG